MKDAFLARRGNLLLVALTALWLAFPAVFLLWELTIGGGLQRWADMAYAPAMVWAMTVGYGALALFVFATAILIYVRECDLDTTALAEGICALTPMLTFAGLVLLVVPAWETMHRAQAAAATPVGTSASIPQRAFDSRSADDSQQGVAELSFCGVSDRRTITAGGFLFAADGNRATFLGREPTRGGLYRVRIDRPGCSDSEFLVPQGVFGTLVFKMRPVRRQGRP